MAEKLKMHSADIIGENISFIESRFPNAIVEAYDDEGKLTKKVDFEILKQELSHVLISDKQERYQMTWPDKKKSILLANSSINGTLRPYKDESVDFDNTQNLYIEGDNLDVLKILRETYLNKIKMVYIDPPYNTGSDFVYEDDFAENAEEYLNRSGQYDDQGNRLVTNTESNGRFHSDWLNMMYPRLKIAKDLLTDDGCIFISIDDNERTNLKKICDEIFGESNFVVTFPWRKRTAKSDVPFGVSQDFEWILCYAKSSSFRASVEGKERKYYETPDFPGRPWRIHDMTKQTTASERPNSFFTMVNPKTGDEYPCDPNRTWRITKDTFQKYYDANEIVFPGDYDFLRISKPVARYFKDKDMLKDGELFGRVALSTKLPDDIGMSQDGTKEMKQLFENIPFPFPKPQKLIKYLVNAVTKDDDIILDFFSGSATTAHAVMQLNKEDNGKRKFIMVQLPELCDAKSEAFRLGYKNICEIGKERIRRASNIILEENDLFASEIDCGFRTLKLDSSNMKDVYYNPKNVIHSLLEEDIDNVKNDRTSLDLLFQVMLDLGVDLSAKIEEKKVGNSTLYIINESYLAACFDKNIDDEVVKAAANIKPVYVVFRDASFNSDSSNINCEQTIKIISPSTELKVI